MRYEVIGAERTTGRDVTRVYEATDEDHATRQANAEGIVVDSVDLLIEMGKRSPPPVTTVLPVKTVPRVTPIVVPAAIATPAVEYRAPTTSDVPAYRGLTIAGTILRCYAALCYAVGVLMFMVATVAAATNFVESSGSGFLVRMSFTLPLLIPSLGLLFAGAVSHGLSAACVALRDIARNSWR